MLTDLPEPELRAHRSAVVDPPDLDAFWAGTLAGARAAGGTSSTVSVEPIVTGLVAVDVFDVTFPGWAGEPVRAWLRLPAAALRQGRRLPTVVEYVGYGGGRGSAVEGLLCAGAGFAHLHVDTRGQGSGWSRGDTPDSGTTGPQVPGVMTRGITSRETYYYRRFFTDAARAVDAARALDAVDPDRVAVVGTSQGGGAALAVAALVPDVAAVSAKVPFLCDVPRALTITDAYPYREVVDHLATHRDQVEQVTGVLRYFNGVNFARRATAPARFSAALMDAVVPPSPPTPPTPVPRSSWSGRTTATRAAAATRRPRRSCAPTWFPEGAGSGAAGLGPAREDVGGRRWPRSARRASPRRRIWPRRRAPPTTRSTRRRRGRPRAWGAPRHR